MTPMLTVRRFLWLIAIYGILSAGVCSITPFFGSEPLSFRSVLGGLFSHVSTVDAEIFVFHRIPRVLLAFTVGGALAISGGALQVILKNPLAEPYILGIAGGGSLGAVAAISFPGLLIYVGPFSSVQLFSLAGCFLAIWGIYRFAATTAGLSMTTILLAGVTINILCGAAILLLRYLLSPHLLVAMDRWMMGGLDIVGYQDLVALLPFIVPGLLLLLSGANALNHLALGEEMAMGHGVSVGAIQKRILLGTGLSCAAAVSLAGPIGFVGLIIPHAVRRLTGTDSRLVLPASFFLGGSFLTLCDLVARTVVAPTEMPVGIITAMVGGPVFLHILFRKKGQ